MSQSYFGTAGPRGSTGPNFPLREEACNTDYQRQRRAFWETPETRRENISSEASDKPPPPSEWKQTEKLRNDNKQDGKGESTRAFSSAHEQNQPRQSGLEHAKLSNNQEAKVECEGIFSGASQAQAEILSENHRKENKVEQTKPLTEVKVSLKPDSFSLRESHLQLATKQDPAENKKTAVEEYDERSVATIEEIETIPNPPPS